MILISESVIDDTPIRYYEGIDFNEIYNHPKDGSNGMIACFITRWQDEVIEWKRDNKIKSILNEEVINFNLDEIDNSYVLIYQCENNIIPIYKTIKEKLENNKPIPQKAIALDSSYGFVVKFKKDIKNCN